MNKIYYLLSLYLVLGISCTSKAPVMDVEPSLQYCEKQGIND